MSSVQFTHISRDEFEKFLDENVSYEQVDNSDGEYEYDIPLPAENLTIRIFSTISKRSDSTRGKGSDSIKCVVWDHELEAPVSGREYTKRIRTADDPQRWQVNLLKKIQDLMLNWRDRVRECPACGEGSLVVRDGPYGEFLACNQWDGGDGCTYKESLD